MVALDYQKTIAGVYIERRRIRFAVERVIKLGRSPAGLSPIVEQIAQATYDINPLDSEDSWYQLNQAATLLCGVSKKLLDTSQRPIDGIGIGSYGPFVSLKTDLVGGPYEGYGVLQPEKNLLPFKGAERSFLNLRGKNLLKAFQKPFVNAGIPVPRIAIQTDANVAALGEAWLNGTGADDIVVALVLDSGTGGGFVGGRRSFGTALHPEMGLIQSSMLKDDPLKYSKTLAPIAETIGVLVGIPTMVERAKILKKRREISEDCENIYDLIKITYDNYWRVPSIYVARLCFICTTILSPTTIVLGGPLSHSTIFTKMIKNEFFNILNNLKDSPKFVYQHISDSASNYIRTATRARLPFGLAGSVYLAWDAAIGEAGVTYSPSSSS